jgi:HD-like signal output (HDOD) protein
VKHTHSHAVESWIQQLSEEDMPVFSGTVTEVTNSVNSDSSSASDVAHTILKDASLTGRLLKMANSLYYNPSRYSITTVTRAVMVLGFNQVRVLALSLVLIDSLDKDDNRDKMAEEMAQAFHAAVQAESLAQLTEAKEPENVFVATLLSRLGNLAFWAFSGEKGHELQALINKGELSVHDAEMEVLGFALSDLSKELSKAWSLGELLENSFSHNFSNDPLVKLVHMGQELADASKQGWDEDEARTVVKKIASDLNLPVETIEDRVHQSAKVAKNVTKDYGIIEASRHIPQANIELLNPEFDKTQNKHSDDEIQLNEAISNKHEGDQEIVEEKPSLQQSLLQEIKEAIAEKPSLNIIIEMVLEGIIRGVEMDKALFAILSKDRKSLICKYALGSGTETLNQKFIIDISHESNIFHQVITSLQGAHIPGNPKEVKGTINKLTIDLLGFPPYLIMPTIVKDKVIGVFVADRNTTKRKIGEEDFLEFQQFCEQASVGLTFLSTQD